MYNINIITYVCMSHVCIVKKKNRMYFQHIQQNSQVTESLQSTETRDEFNILKVDNYKH